MRRRVTNKKCNCIFLILICVLWENGDVYQFMFGAMIISLTNLNYLQQLLSS